MLVWRLCREEYADLSGIGASLYGGRWNSPGHAVVYTSSTLSLSFVEIIPGLRKGVIPLGFVSILIDIKDNISKTELSLKDFPPDWRTEKSKRWFTETGDRWLQAHETALFIVPSAIIPEEKNILINPHHPESAFIRIKTVSPFQIDERFMM